MAQRRLKTYLDKRDFSRTPEPTAGRSGQGQPPLFVIHKHDARNLHYDLRLEIDGVLKSWAVPKGPSTDPRDKRLAVQTEDHPLDYADFEGVIPEHQYGGGTVLVWDVGSFRNLKVDDDGNETKSLSDCWHQGHLTVWLEGQKLTGGYALTRFRPDADPPQWLLVKMDDEAADARRNPVSTQPDSVLSGRGLDEIEAQEPPS